MPGSFSTPASHIMGLIRTHRSSLGVLEPTEFGRNKTQAFSLQEIIYSKFHF